MKKAELVAKLNEIAALDNADIRAALAAFIDQIGPVAEVAEGKVQYLVKINERVIDPAVKYPRQMIECHQILLDAGLVGTEVDRAEVIRLINEHADRLATRQSPERIYAFYQKRMEDECWIERVKVRA